MPILTSIFTPAMWRDLAKTAASVRGPKATAACKAAVPRRRLPVFVGASQVYAKTDISTDSPLVNRIWQRVLGQQSTSSALGVVAEYDTTNNFFYPKKGLSLQGEYRFTAPCSGVTISTTSFHLTVNTLFR